MHSSGMTRKPASLAIDQGTTSSRAIVFDQQARPISIAQKELTQHFPADGWVEHDAEEIWRDTHHVVDRALGDARAQGYSIIAAGITNQRETTVIWDRETGKPIHNAIVWQDRRTADACQALKDEWHEAAVAQKTGLLLDPYFSATKIAWILDNIEGARAAADAGKLAFGTIDTWLLWNLTDGEHKTDASNASRTALFNLHSQQWDEDLLDLFNIPSSLLPSVEDNCAHFGTTELFGDPIPIWGMVGDQQAATFGQACFKPGMLKSTYGTGCFALLNTGDQPVMSQNRLLTTTAWRLNGEPTYALEGSIFVAGAAVQWLRDELGIISASEETEEISASLEDNGGVYLVPAFTGLGAPWWAPEARGALYGLTRDTGKAHIVRATIESAAYQTVDLLDALGRDWTGGISEIRVDGGMANNNWLMHFLSDVTRTPVTRPAYTETTALGAALLAGLGAGIWQNLDDIAAKWSADSHFIPTMSDDEGATLMTEWHAAIRRTLNEIEE